MKRQQAKENTCVETRTCKYEECFRCGISNLRTIRLCKRRKLWYRKRYGRGTLTRKDGEDEEKYVDM